MSETRSEASNTKVSPSCEMIDEFSKLRQSDLCSQDDLYPSDARLWTTELRSGAAGRPAGEELAFEGFFGLSTRDNETRLSGGVFGAGPATCRGNWEITSDVEGWSKIGDRVGLKSRDAARGT